MSKNRYRGTFFHQVSLLKLELTGFEPSAESPILEPDRVDLILVPCVACDLRGYRLGYGGGFYDRLLSAPEWKEKPTIGIVFQSAVVSELAIDPWDHPLQGICTEQGYLRIN